MRFCADSKAEGGGDFIDKYVYNKHTLKVVSDRKQEAFVCPNKQSKSK
jgi:hypothetical protein